jgi:hypothetical protein
LRIGLDSFFHCSPERTSPLVLRKNFLPILACCRPVNSDENSQSSRIHTITQFTGCLLKILAKQLASGDVWVQNRCIFIARRFAMKAALQRPFVEQFRESNTPYLSPSLVGDLFGFQVQELAERAHVHRNTPTARPHTPQLQKYLQDMVRVLSVATGMTGDEKRAAFLLRNEPLRAFKHKTADVLIQEGRADDVIAYLESFADGAAG